MGHALVPPEGGTPSQGILWVYRVDPACGALWHTAVRTRYFFACRCPLHAPAINPGASRRDSMPLGESPIPALKRRAILVNRECGSTLSVEGWLDPLLGGTLGGRRKIIDPPVPGTREHEIPAAASAPSEEALVPTGSRWTAP